MMKVNINAYALNVLSPTRVFYIEDAGSLLVLDSLLPVVRLLSGLRHVHDNESSYVSD